MTKTASKKLSRATMIEQ